MDVISKAGRSRIMRSIRSTNTKPELAVRSALHRLGYRFRVHVGALPGKPDIVLPRYRTIIWIHGCFWHGHRTCRAGIRPKSNVAYWYPKIDRNITRDLSIRRKLSRMGWKNYVLWECDIENEQRLASKLRKINSDLQTSILRSA